MQEAQRLVLLADVCDHLAVAHNTGVAEPVPASLLCASEGVSVLSWDEFTVTCTSNWFGADVSRYPTVLLRDGPSTNRELALRLVTSLEKASMEKLELLRLLLPCCRRTWNRALDSYRSFISANGGVDECNTQEGPAQRAFASVLLQRAVKVALYTWAVCEQD
jgi:hypothetical protein